MGADVHPKYIKHPLIWPETIEFRLYQKKIADIAFERNTLVILPTALGKTVISALVAAEVFYQYSYAKILVMAPTRPLVLQHSLSFTRLLKLRKQDTVLLTGKTPPRSRRHLWESKARIFFSTPQVVRNDLLNSRLSLEAFGLVVFDECHRAVKNYAYTEIARFYVSQALYPLILGMTASPGADMNRVSAICRNLYIEQVEYRSEDDPDVRPYLQPIELDWKQLKLPPEYMDVRSHLKAMLDRRLHWLYSRRLLKTRPTYATRRQIIELGDQLRSLLNESVEEEKGRIFTAIINQALALTLFHMLELLETQGLWTLRRFLQKIEREKYDKRSYAILVKEPEYLWIERYIQDHFIEHPKIGILRQIIHDQIQTNASSRILVFTQYRDTASHLVSELNTLEGVRAARFVGQASKLRDKGLTQDEQAKRIQELEEGSLNVLVATSIAEEGLDIPAIDHVIFYEPIPSEIRYIQRRGRTGRKSPGKATILTTVNSLDMIYLYASRKRTRRMKETASKVNRTLHKIIRSQRPPPTPMTLKEIRIHEEEAKTQVLEPDTIMKETESLKEFNKEVTRVAKRAYLRLLESGSSGVYGDQLSTDLELEGINTSTMKSALEKLRNENLITITNSGKIIPSSSLATGNTYELVIEKITHRSAVVLVDNKWRARLVPEDYEGPRTLIKKNSRFRAVARLYRVDGTLCIQIKKVTEILT